MHQPYSIQLFLINFNTLQSIVNELNTLIKNKTPIIFEIQNNANWDYEELLQYNSNKLAETFELLQKITKQLEIAPNTTAILSGNTLGSAASIALACQKIEINHPTHSVVSLAFPEIKAKIPAVVPKIKQLLKKNIYFPALTHFLGGNPVAVQQAQYLQIISPKNQTQTNFFTQIKNLLYFGVKNNYMWFLHKKHIPFATQKKQNLKHIFAKNIHHANPKLYLLTTEFKQKTEKNNPPIHTTVAVIGAGRMGGGIALTQAQTSSPTLLYDQHTPTLQKACTQIQQHAELNEIPLNLLILNNLNEVKKANFIIESIAEDLTLKQKLLAQCEEITKPDCIFASNTSSIPIQQIAQNAKRPEHVIGMHYFFPVPNKPLLEIVTTPKTNEHAKKMAIAVAQQQQKYYILVNDCPCFFANRILVPILNEAMLLLQQYGVSALSTLNKIPLQAGFSFGAFELLDETGIDLASHIFSDSLIHFFKNQNPYFEKSTLIDTLYQHNCLGKKNNNGFFIYHKQQKQPNPLIASFLQNNNTQILDTQQVANRLITATIVETLFCLQDNTIQNPHHANIGSVYGAGFPIHTGGVLKYIDQQGLTHTLKMIEQINNTSEKQKYIIPQILIDYEKKGKRFCD